MSGNEIPNQEPNLPPLPPYVGDTIMKVNCDVDKSNQIQMPMMIAPGNHARAWNDPPMFGVAVNVSNSGKPAGITKLNKRVAFPLSSTPSTNSTPMPLIGLPPMNPPSLPVTQQIPFVPAINQFVPTTNVNFVPSSPMPPSFITKISSEGPDNETINKVSLNEMCKEDDNRDGDMDAVLSTLRKAINDSSLEVIQKEEVNKRLELISTDWIQFEEKLKFQLSQLAKSVEIGNYKEADKIQVDIGQDYMSQHSSWILALRNVIRVLLIGQESGQVS